MSNNKRPNQPVHSDAPRGGLAPCGGSRSPGALRCEMKKCFLIVAVLIIALTSIANGQKNESPEEQIRRHLRLDPKAPIDIWSIRSKVLQIVHIGQPWQSVEKAMAPYGLDRYSEARPTPCGPGDNGLLCSFQADAEDPGGKRTYWIEFFYWGDDINNQVLEDVAVTLFLGSGKGKEIIKSTSKYYTNMQ